MVGHWVKPHRELLALSCHHDYTTSCLPVSLQLKLFSPQPATPTAAPVAMASATPTTAPVAMASATPTTAPVSTEFATPTTARANLNQLMFTLFGRAMEDRGREGPVGVSTVEEAGPQSPGIRWAEFIWLAPLSPCVVTFDDDTCSLVFGCVPVTSSLDMCAAAAEGGGGGGGKFECLTSLHTETRAESCPPCIFNFSGEACPLVYPPFLLPSPTCFAVEKGAGVNSSEQY